MESEGLVVGGNIRSSRVESGRRSSERDWAREEGGRGGAIAKFLVRAVEDFEVPPESSGVGGFIVDSKLPLARAEEMRGERSARRHSPA